MPDFSQQFAALSPAQRSLLIQRLQAKAGTQQQKIARRADSSTYPLSFAQQRLWFLNQMQPDIPLYNIAMPIEIRMERTLESLQDSIGRCLSAILARHEALRATFTNESGVLVQRLVPPQPIELPAIDVSHLPEREREDEARRMLNAEAWRPFDLSNGPLLRAMLLRLRPDLHILLLTVHHIAFDAWSVGVLMREMAEIFRKMSAGEPLVLPDLPLQYADFAAWQRGWLQGKVLEQQLAYWKERLANLPPPLTLPMSQPRPEVRTCSGAREAFVVPADVVAALSQLSSRQGATLFMTLLAAWKLLLFRYSGQSDLVVGSPIANRNRSEIEGLIGFFVNTLALRTNLAGDPTFVELLDRVREVMLGAYAHQDLPFEMLVEEVQPQRDLSITPLFQMLFVLQNVPLPVETSQETGITLLPDLDGPAQFEVTLSLVEVDGGLRGMLEYNTDLFDAGSIQRMAEHFTTLLRGIASDPDQRLSRLPLLTPAEWHEQVVAWNETAAPFPADQPAHALFEEQAMRAPDAVAVRYLGQELKYAELNRRADQLARYLLALGVEREDRIGLCVERSPEMVIGLLGILKAGAAYVPLDPSYPQERLAFVLEDSRMPLLLTQRDLASRLSVMQTRLVCLDEWTTIAQAETDEPLPQVQPHNLAYVIYTSGSTGRPKGTLLEHRGLNNLALDYAQRLGVAAGSRMLQFFSFGFDGAVAEVFLTLLTGATLCIADPRVPLSGTQLLDQLRDEAITTVILPPSVMAVLEPDRLPNLHTIGSAGDSCSAAVVTRWGQGRRFFNVYGPTETTVAATLFQAVGDWSQAASIPIGRPLANTQVYILDQQLQPVPIGVPGEIYIGGAGLARGYLNRPDLTAERFIPHPFSVDPSARVYRTGDRGRFRPDGTIEFVERADAQVKIRGFRVEPGEIEAALRQHPIVQEAVVVAQPDGIGGKRLVAYVIEQRTENKEQSADRPGVWGSPPSILPHPSPAIVEEGALRSSGGEGLRAFLQERLPDYMIPAAFEVVDALPLTLNGKVDRKALAEREVIIRAASPVAFVAPQTELEHKIAAIWQEVLHREGIGVNDNFFDIGGTSLNIIAVQSLLQPMVVDELSTLTLFQYPTIKALAEHLNSRSATPPPAQSAADRAQKQKAMLQRQRTRARR